MQNLALKWGRDNLRIPRRRSEKIWNRPQILQVYHEFRNIQKRESENAGGRTWENIETSQLACGLWLCKRSSIHTRDNTIAKERLSDSSCCGDKTRLGGIPSIFSVYLQALAWPASIPWSCGTIDPGNCQLFLISCFEEVRIVCWNVLGHMLQEAAHTQDVKLINNGSD